MTNKILITGTSGLIGYNLAERLLKDGYEVYGTIHKNKKEVEGVKYFYGDLRDMEYCKEITKGTPSKMAMMSPKQRAEFKLKSMKKMGLKPGDLQKKPGGRPKLTKSQMLLQAQGKDLKGGQLFTGEKRKDLKNLI